MGIHESHQEKMMELLTYGLADYFAQTTTGNGLGFYFFGDLPPGTYLEWVDATTLPTGITQPTHDFDGISTPHKATVAVGPGGSVFNVKFSYRAAPLAVLRPRESTPAIA